MAHFALLWKARTIEKYRQNYENEKLNSIIMSNADLPDKTLLQRWRHYSHSVQRHLSRTFSKWYPEGTTMSSFLVNFRAEMKFPHILLRSLFGFVGGLLLTYLCFVFLVWQLSLSLVLATVLSSLFGVLITLGLTFSNRMRCIVFLLIPQLFSRAGRYTVTCYALVLILTGPATNTLKNSEVLSESMACSQEQIKTSVREINQSLNKPYNSIKESIKLMVEEMKRITLILRSTMLKVNRLILSIASIIQSGFSWLGYIAQLCNDQLGTPYNRCVTALKTSVDNCKTCSDKAPWYYAAASVARVACGVLKHYDKFCVASDFAGETFYATVRRKLKTLTSRISEAQFLKIRTRHSYTFVGNTSSPSQVAAGIMTEIRNRADPILTWLSWSSCVTSLFLLLIIFRAKYYQHMYETRSRFDNRYITKEFRELDLKRLREGRLTVLPLSNRERAKYVTTTSFRLVTSEKIYLNRSAVFMAITSFKLLIHMVADYSLYWVLMTIRYHGALQSPAQSGLPKTGAHITGTGFVSRLLQALLDILNIPLASAPSSNSCLPKPHPPDFKRYSQIGTLISLLWVFGLFEPYGLRLRHLIMGHYKPERAKTRAAWLYNHILRTRGSFMKFTRRKLHREYKHCSENKHTFRYWLRSLIPFRWLRCLLGVQMQPARCLLCNSTKNFCDVTELIRCEVPNCPGVYCASCFTDIDQMCTICLAPADYGDLSDISLEKGSSDEEHSDGENDSDKTNNDNVAFNECIDSVCDEDTFTTNNSVHSKYDTENSVTKLECEMSFLVCNGNTMPDRTMCKNKETNITYNSVSKILTNSNGDKVVTPDTPPQKGFRFCKLVGNNFGLVNSFAEIDINRNVLNNKLRLYVYYSFYRINVHNHKYFVVTKIGREASFLKTKITKNKKISTQKHYLSINCNGDKREGTNKTNKDEQQNVPGCEKNVLDKKHSNDNIPHNFFVDDVTKISMKPQKLDASKLSNKKNPHIERFHAKFSKYCKSVSDVLSCAEMTNMKKLLPVTEEKKHKRKKKHKKCKESPKKYHKSRSNDYNARQFRIFTYLADQDWKKKKVGDKAEIGSSLRLNTQESFEENEVEVNHIKIPRLNLHLSSDSLTNKEKRIFVCTADLPQNGIQCHKSKSDFSMSRCMKYFRALGNDYGLQETQKSCICRGISKTNHSNVYSKSEANNKTTFREHGISMHKVKPLNKDATINESKPIDHIKTKVIKAEGAKSKKSLFDLTKKWSNVKRQSSEIFSGFGLKGPITLLKDMYTSIFCASDSSESKAKNKKSTVKQTADKGIAVYPCMQSCGCQNSQKNLKKFDRSIQVEQKTKANRKKKNLHSETSVFDVQVDAVRSTCTCATQHYVTQRDVGTLKTQKPLQHQESSGTESSDENEFSLDSDSSFTNLSDGTLTNTTVCSLATVNFRSEVKKPEGERRKRLKVKVVTKANRSTLTDKANVCDVSTVTGDWWSPIVEKKNDCNNDIVLENKKHHLLMKNKGKRYMKTKAIMTDGRIVTFRSRAQIIPSNSCLSIADILSPSRYLLESQRYYNELFSSKLYSPHVFPVFHTLKHQKLELRSPVGSRHQNRRGRRLTKRLEEGYSRKQTPREKRAKESSKASDFIHVWK